MIAVLGFLAAALSISTVWPQVWLSCRHGRTLGLSPTGSWLAVSLNACWLTFGVLTGDPAQIVTHVVLGGGNTAVLLALLATQPQLRSARALRRSAAGGAALGALAVSSVAAVLLGVLAPGEVAVVLGVLITLAGMAAALPQLLGLLFDPSRDLSGLSPARWYLGAASSACWSGYGSLLHQPMVELSAGFGLVCAVTTCAVLAARQPAALGSRLTRTATRQHAVRPVHVHVPRPALVA
jgi:uncharacterized protein with PQ loop repeat